MYKQIASNKRKSYLLMLLFFVVLVGIVWVYSQYFGTDSGYSMVIFAVILATGMNLVSFYAGDSIALSIAGAKPINKEKNPYVYRMVENLSITAGLPMPKIYIISDPAMNAFATGRDPKHASIALTSGIIEGLENEELEGVIAHELSHVKNYDIRLMMIVIVCVGVIALLADWMTRSLFWRNRDNNERGNNGIFLIIGLVLAILSPIFAKLIQLAISRKREFLADASGALLTRYPEGLARALEKISSQKKALRHANKATAHLYIANPFGSEKMANLFSTHPPVAARLAALRSM
ncbi:MAG: M48 family metallopeptidase [Patescibacteria group bacterium]|jgi:heat shock protein HtpX